MEPVKTLEDLYEGKIDIDRASELLALEETAPVSEEINKKHLKRAHFVKVSIRLPNEPRRINWLMRFLCALPVPVGLINFGLRLGRSKLDRQLAEVGLDTKELRTIIRYARGTRVLIEAEDARITVKIV